MSYYKDILEQLLQESAFRRGTSTHRLGLIPQGISDHLPITICTKHQHTSTTLLSWNMLADVHLYNNFMNISGTEQLVAAISTSNVYGGHAQRNKLYYYFSELGQFLYDQRKDNYIEVSHAILAQFSALEQCKMESRQEIAAILLNHPNTHEFKLAIQHSVDLIYHIQHEHGALKWQNRLAHLKNNSALCKALSDADFLCLQECTNPSDIQALVEHKTALTYRINDKTNDHCALFYDNQQFEIIGEPRYCALDNGKKPCIMARFKHRTQGHELIVGSVHHPGGNHHCIAQLIDYMNPLKISPDEDIACYLSGDYNHEKAFFQEHIAPGYQLLYPRLGTMAGNDYDNINKPIDAVLTNISPSAITLERIQDLFIPQPADLPLRIHFSDFAPSFELPVQGVVSHEEAVYAEPVAHPSNLNHGPRVDI
jgi:hypothetical protein